MRADGSWMWMAQRHVCYCVLRAALQMGRYVMLVSSDFRRRGVGFLFLAGPRRARWAPDRPRHLSLRPPPPQPPKKTARARARRAARPAPVARGTRHYVTYIGSPNGPIQRTNPVRYVQYECPYETTAGSETRKLARVRPARCPA
jgi:hypothetical protein